MSILSESKMKNLKSKKIIFVGKVIFCCRINMLSNVRTWIVMACYRRLSLNEKQYCLSDYEVVSMNRLAQVPLIEMV